MSDYVPIEVMDIMFAVLPLILDEDEESIPYHTSILTGQRKYDELINHENPHYFRAEARMDKETFCRLLAFLRQRGGLRDSKHICGGQKIMIYISVLKGFTIERFDGIQNIMLNQRCVSM